MNLCTCLNSDRLCRYCNTHLTPRHDYDLEKAELINCRPDRTGPVVVGQSIDCAGTDPTLPCHVMRLIDEVRESASMDEIDRDVFCPCKDVRDRAPNWDGAAVASCNGGR